MSPGRATARHRFRAVLVATFAGLALLLAMVGMFGVLAYSVQQRVRDFGVRRALGATSADVLRLVVGNAARVIAAGAVIGLGAAVMFSRMLTTMLFGVEPLDPATFGFVRYRAGSYGRGGGRRPGLARGPHRSGGRAAGGVRSILLSRSPDRVVRNSSGSSAPHLH